jgi:hypothetical protein
MRVPLGEDEWNVSTKSDDDVQMGMMQRMQQRYEGKTDWTMLIKRCEKIPSEKLPSKLAEMLLPTLQPRTAELINGLASNGAHDELVKTLTAHLMSTPEYQLC